MSAADSPAERRLAEARQRVREEFEIVARLPPRRVCIDSAMLNVDDLVAAARAAERERLLSGQQDADAELAALRRHDKRAKKPSPCSACGLADRHCGGNWPDCPMLRLL